MTTFRYRIALRPLSIAEGGGWLAEVPELPGCMSDGETPQEAVDNVMDAIARWIEAAEEDSRPVPAPTPPGIDVRAGSGTRLKPTVAIGMVRMARPGDVKAP